MRIAFALAIATLVSACEPSESAIHGCMCMASSSAVVGFHGYDWRRSIREECYPKFGQAAVDKYWEKKWMKIDCVSR